MLKSRIFMPAAISRSIELANEECVRLGYYIIHKADAVKLIVKHHHLFAIDDVRDCVESAVVHNSTRAMYVGLKMVSKQNDGVVLSAYIPRDIMNYARDVNLAIKSRVGIRAWHIALHFFREAMSQKSERELVDAFVLIAKRQTEAVAKLQV